MLRAGLDEYTNLDSPIHRWEVRYKLVGMGVLILAFSFVQDIWLLPLMLAVTALIYAVSRMPPAFLLERFQYPGIFLLAMAVLLPFFTGTTVLWQLGPLALHKEGLMQLLVIVTKFVAILTISLVLFSTAPFLRTIGAMRLLGLPPVMADMTLLAYRYLFEIGDDLDRMETAMRLRGFKIKRFSLRGVSTLASLAGSILVRSFERSERIYKAMLLRGYGNATHGRFSSVSAQASTDFSQQRNAMLMGVFLLVAAGFVVVELLLRVFTG